MKSILIVLSSKELCQRFFDVLSRANYYVITADSGEAALALASAVCLDLVLMAIVMPGLDGLQTAARLRALPGVRRGSIVLLGAITPIGIDDEPLASLVDDYLNLDASADELLACVTKHVGVANG